MVNSYWEPLEFDIDPVSGPWRRIIDTYPDSPDDISDWADAPMVQGPAYTVQPRSVVLLASMWESGPIQGETGKEGSR